MRYWFATYRFDFERGLEGSLGHVALGRRDSTLLKLLLEADGRIVSKETIAAAVWPGQPVSDESIAQSLRRLRTALPAAEGQKIIQSVYGAGVRIGVPVFRHQEAATPRPPPRGGSSIGAEALLTSARELAASRTPVGLFSAIDAAQRALDLDPDFVAAWSALAELELICAVRSIAEPRRAAHRAADAADRALALDRDCVAALAIRGFVAAVVEGDMPAGRTDLELALSIDAGYWVTRGLHGWLLLADGRPGDAVQEVRAAIELNPFAHWFSGMYSQYLLFAGDGKAALAAGRDAIRRFPDIDYPYFATSQVASALDLHDEAIAMGRRAMQLAPETPLLHTSLASALARAGRRQESLALIRRIEDAGFPIPAVWLAPAWLALGERERAVEMLALARAQGAPQYVYARYDPRMGELNPSVTASGEAFAPRVTAPAPVSSGISR
jgi:DNA-binding winged helix-turn-helix (wHTH) protein